MQATSIDQSPQDVADWRERRLGKAPCIHPSCEIRASVIGPWTDLGPGCRLVECRFGAYSYAHEAVDIWASEVGRFCSIASHVRINPGNHPMDRPCQHHCTYRRRLFDLADDDDDDFFTWRRRTPCRIGHDVWLGHGATVMPGITVGTGAVVGSGAVVTKDVPPFAIVGGVPAKVIRYRFDEELIDGLLTSAWWDWDHATLRQRLPELAGDCRAFVARYGTNDSDVEGTT